MIEYIELLRKVCNPAKVDPLDANGEFITITPDELDTYTAAAIEQATEQLQAKYDDVCLKWHDAVDAREQLRSQVVGMHSMLKLIYDEQQVWNRGTIKEALDNSQPTYDEIVKWIEVRVLKEAAYWFLYEAEQDEMFTSTIEQELLRMAAERTGKE